jgi:hypothetical protein
LEPLPRTRRRTKTAEKSTKAAAETAADAPSVDETNAPANQVTVSELFEQLHSKVEESEALAKLQGPSKKGKKKKAVQLNVADSEIADSSATAPASAPSAAAATAATAAQAIRGVIGKKGTLKRKKAEREFLEAVAFGEVDIEGARPTAPAGKAKTPATASSSTKKGRRKSTRLSLSADALSDLFSLEKDFMETELAPSKGVGAKATLSTAGAMAAGLPPPKKNRANVFKGLLSPSNDGISSDAMDLLQRRPNMDDADQYVENLNKREGGVKGFNVQAFSSHGDGARGAAAAGGWKKKPLSKRVAAVASPDDFGLNSSASLLGNSSRKRKRLVIDSPDFEDGDLDSSLLGPGEGDDDEQNAQDNAMASKFGLL